MGLGTSGVAGCSGEARTFRPSGSPCSGEDRTFRPTGSPLGLGVKL